MKHTFFVPISFEPKEIELEINATIDKLEDKSNIVFLPDLCKPVMPLMYMLTYEDVVGGIKSTSQEHSIGAYVIKSSENMKETEDIINEAFSTLRLHEDYNFVSITHPSEFIYIILYECRAGSFPTAKILPIIQDPVKATGWTSAMLNDMYKDGDFDLEPFDSFMVDKTNLLMLFG